MEQISTLVSRLRETARLDPIGWASCCKVNLRPYQRRIALAVKDSVIHHRGLTFVVILPRQSGKNELQSHLFSWLLYRYAHEGGRIVSVSPTFKPQTLNNMDRVRHSLDSCVASRRIWHSSSGYMFCLGNARLQFFSGDNHANVVGATADLLLSVDEAQSVSILKFDKDFDPMTASTNATRIFWGTAWTSDTLLERERRSALRLQESDGVQRLFYYTAEDVYPYVPAYRSKVDEVVGRLGRDHPLVRTQYFCETVDAQGSMFNAARLLRMEASLTQLSSPNLQASGLQETVSQPADLSSLLGLSGYAFLIDVAGTDESKLAVNPSNYDSGLANPGRDSTTLTIVGLDLSTLTALRHPSYHVVGRYSWQGENQVTVFDWVKRLASRWAPKYLVVDATGVGEGLWGMLARYFSEKVIPVKFTQQDKSEIGWRFLSVIETGRFHDHCHTPEVHLQYAHCLMEVLPGPNKILRWGVSQGTRSSTGELIHDDYVVADSLVSILDRFEWVPYMATAYIELDDDPLDKLLPVT